MEAAPPFTALRKPPPMQHPSPCFTSPLGGALSIERNAPVDSWQWIPLERFKFSRNMRSGVVVRDVLIRILHASFSPRPRDRFCDSVRVGFSVGSVITAGSLLAGCDGRHDGF